MLPELRKKNFFFDVILFRMGRKMYMIFSQNLLIYKKFYSTKAMGGSPGAFTKLILQPFRHFTCVTTHSPTLPSLYLHHSSFSNPSVASPTSQFILQPFFRFSYVTSSSLNSPGELPMTKAVFISTGRSYGWSFWQISNFEFSKKAMK